MPDASFICTRHRQEIKPVNLAVLVEKIVGKHLPKPGN